MDEKQSHWCSYPDLYADGLQLGIDYDMDFIDFPEDLECFRVERVPLRPERVEFLRKFVLLDMPRP